MEVVRAVSVRLAAVLLVVTTLLPTRPAEATEVRGYFDHAGESIGVWAPTNMSSYHQYTEAEAVGLASRVDLITAIPAAFSRHIGAMRAANPGLTVLVYMNAAYVPPHRSAAYPETWYARDALGRKITSLGFGNYLMDVGNPAWRDEVVALCKDALERSGYDGCYADMLTPAPVNPNYGTGVPINPSTGTEWTDVEFLAATHAIVSHLKGRLPAALITGNALHNGPRYFHPTAPSRPLAMVLDGAHAEDFLRGAADGVLRFPTEERWRQHVDMLVDVEARGRSVMATTKLWVPATATQTQEWYHFAVATFLLGSSGRSYFGFTAERSKAGADPASNPSTDVRALGTAVGPYAVHQPGVYARRFANGLVAVNPTAEQRTFALDRTYRATDGREVSTLVMAPHSGHILISEPPAPPPEDWPEPTPPPEAEPSGACPEELVPTTGFTDLVGNVHVDSGACIVWYGLTQGITPTRYGPAGHVTRAQIASFIARWIERTGVTLDVPRDQGFTDITDNVHADRINQMAALGVVRGTTATTFAPREPVRRDQMASLLVRVYEWVAQESLDRQPTAFTDVSPNNVHRENIDKVATAHWTRGTTPTTYAPDDPVRRDQMASFLARVLERGHTDGHVTRPGTLR